MNLSTPAIAGFLLAFAGTASTLADTINVPGDYLTIQEAIDASSDGDTIAIAEGTYYEHSLGIGDQDEELNLSVIGETHADGMPAVTIDAQQQGRVLTVGGYGYGQFNSEFHLSNLIITGGGNVDKGGGIYSGFGLTLENCTIINNTATSQGGGLWNAGVKGDERTYPTFTGCRFMNNSAPAGGGLWLFYAISTFTDCIISQNTADDGGSIYQPALTRAELAGCVVCGNTPNQIVGDWKDLGGTCLNSLCSDDDDDGIPDSCASDDDGTLHVPDEYDSIASALKTVLDGETILIAAGTYAESGYHDLAGKAIAIRGAVNPDGTPATIIDCGSQQIFHCITGEGPGMVFENLHITNGYSGSFGGAMFMIESSPTVNNCVFSNNSSAYLGGAVFCEGGSPTFTDCKFINNEANLKSSSYSFGGGAIGNVPFYSSSSVGHLTFIDCEFADNIAYSGTSANGGGAITMYGSSLTLTDCAITGNSGVTAGGIAFYEVSESAFVLSGTNVCGNDPGQIYGDWTDNGGNYVEDVCIDDCLADLTGDGVVDGADLTVLLGDWGESGGPADIDGSGLVDGADLTMLLGEWGDC